MIYDEKSLDDEEERRKYCVTMLRHGDMGEQATNSLMEQLSDNSDILNIKTSPRETQTPGRAFKVKEVISSTGNKIVFQTRIGALQASSIMVARLRTLYVNQHPIYLLTPRYLSNFSRAVFMILYRYEYVDPGFKRQGFLPPQYFEAISTAFDKQIDLECFSSAFNTTVPNYCSLFPDVEAAFGSIGSFFDLDSLEGLSLIQASPPRVGKITVQGVEHCVKLLKKTRHECHIILLTPLAWPDVTRMITDSGLCVWHNRVKRGDNMRYLDVVKNVGDEDYAMPRVSVLGTTPISSRTSDQLHAAFSS